MQAIPELKLPAKPWYREPWPWLLMAGPFAVIVAGVYTTLLAIGSFDGLVADDYYKRGLAINKTKGREDRASALGLAAGAVYDAAGGRLRVTLAGRLDPPTTLVLRLTHPTRAGMDRQVELGRGPDGAYTGGLVLPPGPGRWNAVLETAEWRLAGAWADPAHGTLALGTATP